MEQKNIPYLCGGTLFLLFERAKPESNMTAKDREKGRTDGLSNPEMLKALIKVVTGINPHVYGDSFKKNTSQYRKCEINGNSYIPFNNNDTVQKFDNEIKSNYTDVVLRMIEFTENFISRYRANRLIRELIDVISKDKEINDDAVFYINSDGTVTKKSNLVKLPHIDLQPFLVGILHYILLYRKDNTSGKPTFDDWCNEAPPHTSRKIRDDFNIGSEIKTTVSWCKISDFQHSDNISSKTEETAAPDNTSDHSADDEPPTATVVEEETHSDTGAPHQTTIIHNQTNVVQYGDKSISLVNNGTINIDL